MKTGAFILLTVITTYYVASLIQTIFHRFFGHVPRYYAIPLIPLVCAAYCLLPGTYFIAHLCGVAFAIWWHIYLHRQYHIRGAWWERFAWFREKRQLHFLHHQKPHKNFAIVEYSWDLLFGTFDDGFSTAVVQTSKRINL
jgi:sterol desaturase/sphingolipid hydroxylase (fatty acid hydroxylase superfamily)